MADDREPRRREDEGPAEDGDDLDAETRGAGKAALAGGAGASGAAGGAAIQGFVDGAETATGASGQGLAGGATGQGLAGGSGGEGLTGGAGAAGPGTSGHGFGSSATGQGIAGGQAGGQGLAGGTGTQGVTGGAAGQGVTGGAGGQGLTGGSGQGLGAASGAPPSHAPATGAPPSQPPPSPPQAPDASATQQTFDPGAPATQPGATTSQPAPQPSSPDATGIPGQQPSPSAPPAPSPPPRPNQLPVPTPSGTRPAVLWIALGCAVVLVILGAVIIDRNRSDDDATVIGGAVTGPGSDADPSAGPGGDGSAGPNAGTGQRDICELLPQDFAESVTGTGLQVGDTVRGLSCEYVLPDGSDYPKVSLTSTGPETGLWSCGPQHLCGQIDEPLPSLPDGEVWWWDQHPRKEPGDAGFLGGAWVRWQVNDDFWELHYWVEIPASGSDITGQRDQLVAEAERIHQDIMTNPERWDVGR